MKALLRLAAALVLVGSLSWAPGSVPIHADKPVTGQSFAASWTTSFTVQNQGTATANILITYYNPDGSVALTRNDTVPAGGSKLFFQGNEPGLPNGQFSVIVASDQPIVATTNQQAEGPAMAGAYNGFVGAVETGATFFVPAVLRHYFGFSTFFVVQNAGSGDASITISYFNSNAPAVPVLTVTDTIKPGAGKTYDQEAIASFGEGFNGSAKVTSTQPVAVAVNEVNSAAALLQAYSGFAHGGTSLFLPSILVNYFGWNSSFTVQNVDTADATVSVNFSNGVSLPSFALGPGASKKIFVPNTNVVPAGGTFRGSVVINSTNGRELVAIVDEANVLINAASSYSAFTVGSTTVSLPVILNKYFGWVTSFTAQNVSSNTSTTVSVTCANTAVAQPQQMLAPGASAIWFQPNQFGNTTYNGSCTVTGSPAVPLVVIVDEVISPDIAASLGLQPGDYQMTYNGYPAQ